MANMKYITSPEYGFVIFQDHITHVEMMDRLGLSKDKITSAGFVSTSCEENELICSGRSDSIGKDSRKIDSEFLFKKLSVYEI